MWCRAKNDFLKTINSGNMKSSFITMNVANSRGTAAACRWQNTKSRYHLSSDEMWHDLQNIKILGSFHCFCFRFNKLLDITQVVCFRRLSKEIIFFLNFTFSPYLTGGWLVVCFFKKNYSSLTLTKKSAHPFKCRLNKMIKYSPAPFWLSMCTSFFFQKKREERENNVDLIRQ